MSLILMIGLVGLASAITTNVNVEGENIELIFYYNNSNSLEMDGYVINYQNNESAFEVLSLEKTDDWIFNNAGATLDLNGIFDEDIFLSSALYSGNFITNGGTLGKIVLKRLTNDSITLINSRDAIQISLINGTYLEFEEEITIPAIEIEEEVIEGTPKLTYSKQYNNENITITFSLENNSYEIIGYSLSYGFNSNKLSPFTPTIPQGSIFESFNPLEIKGVYQDEVTISSVLSDTEDSIIANGTLGVMKFKRLTNETTTLSPIEFNVGITLKNGTYIDLPEEIIIDGYIEEVEEEEETPTPTTSSGGSSGGSSGSSSSSSSKKSTIPNTQTSSPTKTQVNQGFVQALGTNDIIKFELSESHSLRVTEIKDKKVTLLIQSDPIFLTLGEYETEIVELDNECLKVYVGQITSKATIHIQTVECQVEEEVEEDEEVLELNEEKEYENMDIYLILSPIIVLILFGITYNIIHRQKKEKEEKEEYRDFLEVDEKRKNNLK